MCYRAQVHVQQNVMHVISQAKEMVTKGQLLAPFTPSNFSLQIIQHFAQLRTYQPFGFNWNSSNFQVLKTSKQTTSMRKGNKNEYINVFQFIELHSHPLTETLYTQ